ncbi:ABC transporter ATP-binding protein [Marinisporobacter balticus]|uniref:Bacitracin transport system ATP-binding protein n=1 Tax=Marinisporobacter balticus TaxID=2018667 RepID=A0A4R2KRG9_9FIRM|nr:ABC transporter ATP-binding protein [Marinisporobacter balticus]TCO76881.1 bacitracin transport system ATP-binding protein [Marinisporobacter balticus]
MEYVLETVNLTKKYKDKNAVDNLNIHIKKGEIYGFLGENGAGKTTTIRMIMGLIKPTQGSIEMFGENISSKKNQYLERIGSIIEFPGFYPNLTAKENLEIHRRLIGIQGKKCIDEALEMSGMKDTKNKLVKEFSLGMKQRLGVARALLHHPEILVLDEPTNGLDPVGIKEMRELILDLSSKKNITVLISSHNLSEIQQMATTIGIIHKGKLVEEIDFETLQNKNRHYIKIKVSDDKKAAMLLEEKLCIFDYRVSEKNILQVYEKLSDSPKINRLLVENHVDVGEIILMKDTLEDYFIKATGGEGIA